MSAKAGKTIALAGLVGGAGYLAYRFLGSSSAATAAAGAKRAASSAAIPVALSPSEFRPLTLESVEKISHNTARFRFKLPSEEHVVGTTVASCIVAKAVLPVKDEKTQEIKEQPVVRPYTPTSKPEQKGWMELVIKRYEGGALTPHMFNMKPGDKLDFKGPFAKIEYKPNQWDHVAMIAGGTGITPMWQVMDKALSDPTDKTKLTLIFANVSPSDILLKPELDALAQAHPDRLKVFYAVDKADKQAWKGFTGYVNEKMLKNANFPAATDQKSMVLVCGNDPMMKAISGPKAQDKSQGEIDPKSLLGRLGFTKEQVYKF